jgi:hypothetical protein
LILDGKEVYCMFKVQSLKMHENEKFEDEMHHYSYSEDRTRKNWQ